MQKNSKNIYSDFGGKRELYDNDYIKTASREFAEETNGFFFTNKLINNENTNALILVVAEPILMRNGKTYLSTYGKFYNKDEDLIKFLRFIT